MPEVSRVCHSSGIIHLVFGNSLSVPEDPHIRVDAQSSKPQETTVSVSQVLGLQTSATMPRIFYFDFFNMSSVDPTQFLMLTQHVLLTHLSPSSQTEFCVKILFQNYLKIYTRSLPPRTPEK